VWFLHYRYVPKYSLKFLFFAVDKEEKDLLLVTGPARVNTLWGVFIRDYARMCIPDLEVLVDYPIDYKFPAFGRNKKGDIVSSGFFPADPASLHTVVPFVDTSPP
jgi:hypothetical protein